MTPNDPCQDNPYTDEEADLEAALSMDKIAKGAFAPIYPLLAQQIVNTHRISKGICVDVGSGPGALSIALAKITDLVIYALDQSPHATRIAGENAAEAGVADRVKPVRENVTAMPFKDNFADLVISRGSIFFWEDKTAAFNDIYRILKPGGKTHIGGGFGSKALKEKIFAHMAEKDDGWAHKVKNRMSPENQAKITAALDASIISRYEISRSDAGYWIHITKE